MQQAMHVANTRSPNVESTLWQLQLAGHRTDMTRTKAQATLNACSAKPSHQGTTAATLHSDRTAKPQQQLPQQQKYCLDMSTATNKLCRPVKLKENKLKDKTGTIEICINESRRATAKDAATHLNCNCRKNTNNQNYCRQPATNSSTDNSNHPFPNNKNSIFKMKLFNGTRKEQQQQQEQNLLLPQHCPPAEAQGNNCPHRQPQQHQSAAVQTSATSSSTTMKNYFHDLMRVAFYGLLLLAHSIQTTEAGCRYEPTRSCEAICRPLWSPIDNNSYQSNAIAGSRVRWNSFNAGDYNCTIRALVLMPDDNRYVASLERVVPILHVAEQHIRASGLLPKFLNFDWMPQDDKCDSAFAAVKAMDGIVKNCSHIMFGPVCDYSLAAVARIAKYFNSHGTPLISVGGSTFDFEKPKTKCSDEFYMLVRTGMLSFETISELTIALMKRNKWSRSILFYEANGQRNVAGQHTCYLMMTSLGKQMRNENMTFAQYRITEKLKNRTQEMTREIGNKNSV